jgi:hypothetical protein
MRRGKRGKRPQQSGHPIPNEKHTPSDQPQTGSDATNAVATSNAERQQPDANTTAGSPQQKTASADVDGQMIGWTAVVGRWTRVLGIFTGLLVAVTIGGVVVSVLQFQALKEANNDNKKALVAVQRAFITVSELKQEPAVRNDGTKYWRVAPIIKNTGNTPAVGVSLVVIGPNSEWKIRPEKFTPQDYSLMSFKLGAPRDPDELIGRQEGDVDFSKSGFSIGPQGSVSASKITNEITAQNGIDAQFNKIGRFIYGSVHYFDAFDISHISKFCFRIDGFFQRTPGDTEPLQNICSHWNCSDEYCRKDKEQYESELERVIQEGRRSPFPPAPLAPPK